jgi:outer membrane protein assembly factor BamB
MFRMNFFALLLLLATFGCKKNSYIQVSYPVRFTDECTDSLNNLRSVWKVVIRKDTLRGIASHIVNNGTELLVFQGEGQGSSTLYNKSTGATIWQRNGFEKNEYPSQPYALYFNKSSIIASNNRHITSYSKVNGAEQWNTREFDNYYLHFRASMINGFLYTGLTKGNQFYDSNYFLIRLNLVNPLKYDTLFELKRTDHFGYMGGTEPPALHINSNSDSILLFKFRTVLTNSQINTSRCFLYAYNLSQRKVQWRLDSLDYDGSIDPPIIEGNKCYVQGFGTIFCLNAETGEVIWKGWCGGRLPGGSNMISYKDRIAVVTLDGRFLCFNKETGAYIYNRKDAAGGLQNFDMGSPSQAVELNGVMYFYGARFFYGVDLTTGNIVMKYESPYRCKRSAAVFSYGGIAKDDELGLIFIEDQYFIYAVKAYR